MEIKASYFAAFFVLLYFGIGIFIVYFFRKRFAGRFGGQGYKFPAVIYFISVPIIVAIGTDFFNKYDGDAIYNLSLSLDTKFTISIFIFAIIPTIIYLGIGMYILSLEHIKGKKGYKGPAIIYFISVPTLILIVITIQFMMNYTTGRFESNNKPVGYEIYKFLVLQDIIPRSGQSLDKEIINKINLKPNKSNDKNEIKLQKFDVLKKSLEINGQVFKIDLDDLKSGEKNIKVSIKKSKGELYLLDLADHAFIETKYSYKSEDLENQVYKIIEYEDFPEFKIEVVERSNNKIYKYHNIPQHLNLYKFTGSKKLITTQKTLLSWLFTYGEDNGYFEWNDISLLNEKQINQGSTDFIIVEGFIDNEKEIKKIVRGLCKNPNEVFKIKHKEFVKDCNKAFLYGFNYNQDILDNHFNKKSHKNVQSQLLAALNEIENKFKTKEKYYALVIGNNNYDHLEKLDAAENDAVVIADVLKNKYGFEVDLLLNADQETTVDTLFNITDKLQNNDNLLIYYAGHGELDKAENRGYWLPVDASYEKRSKWISNQTIVDRIKATKAKHVLLVADSCFSGTLMRSGTNLQNQEPIDEKYIERLKNKKTRLVITSGGNEPVVDSDGGDHSLFALKLIDTLKNTNTVINSQTLFENIRRYVVSNADQTPERAMVHKTGHDGGDFLFFPKN